MKVKRIIHHIDGETMHWEVIYSSHMPVEMPYIAGKFQSLVKDFTKTDEYEIKHSLFNESNLGRIELQLGKNELYYLTVQPATMLSEIYTEPESLSSDIYISEHDDCFIYSFYNNLEVPNISIIAKLVPREEKWFSKLRANLGDISFRQYILKKMLAKSRDKEITPPTSAIGKKHLTLKEVAEYLNLKPKTIYNKTSTNGIPFRKTGKNLLFNKDEIDAWLVRESRQSKK